jgi:hypothetical protein
MTSKQKLDVATLREVVRMLRADAEAAPLGDFFRSGRLQGASTYNTFQFIADTIEALIPVYGRGADETTEAPDINDIYRAGVTQAKYRMHYKAALEKIASGQLNSVAKLHRVDCIQIAKEALDSSPEEPTAYVCPNCANAGCTDCQPANRNLGPPEAPGGIGVIDLAARSYNPFHAMEERLEAAVQPKPCEKCGGSGRLIIYDTPTYIGQLCGPIGDEPCPECQPEKSSGEQP